VPEAEAAAYNALERLHNKRVFPGFATASYSRDGSLLMMGDDHKAHLLSADGESWKRPIPIPEEAGQPWNAVFNPDAPAFIVNTCRFVAVVVDLDGPSYTFRYLAGHSQPGVGGFAANGEWIVTSSWDPNVPVRLWNAKPPHQFITDVGGG